MYGDLDVYVDASVVTHFYAIFHLLRENGSSMAANEMLFLSSIASLYLMLAISPGPNFLVITATAISQSRRQALCVGLGVSTASVVWASLAAVGLGVVLGQYHWAQQLLRAIGGVYLVYIGIRMFHGADRPITQRDQAPAMQGSWQAYRYGLATNLTNPKTLVFFSSAFATLFTPNLALWAKAAAVLVVAAISLTLNTVIANAFSADAARKRYATAKPIIDRLTGGLLIFFGARLLLPK
ncbi:LysE family translocator [Acidovorax sp. SUPP2539]|uniref:LysE family translocator n=2 Tax=Pseudomonadota TaxID=1224 RepID=UPI0024E17F26|nr:LysE family translocator [Acidovorax sp. SUPP2539]